MHAKNLALTANDRILLRICKGFAYAFFVLGLLQGALFVAFEFGVQSPYVARIGASPLIGMFFLAAAMALNFGAQNKELKAQQ